jgi:hypothetical protein
MIYPGDIYNFILPITTPTGVAPNITSIPVITIISLLTNIAIVSSQNMGALNGTQNQVFTYSWNTTSLPTGEYLALVSYSHDAITINSQSLEKVKLGDSRIIGVVAQDATVAKDITVAKDATVAHIQDINAISPQNSATILAIKASTDRLPTSPASTTDLTGITSIITDISNAVLGTWIVDKTLSPNVLTFFNPDNSVLAKFNLSDSSTSSNRMKIS